MERKFDEAVEAYNEALAFDDTPAPVRARILLHRASALMLLDAWTKAEKDFRSVLEIAEVCGVLEYVRFQAHVPLHSSPIKF